LIARNKTTDCHILMGMANRHGLITGATGTGKTVSLQTLAENFSKQGVPVFMADVKGDLVGISQSGHLSDKLKGILKDRQLDEPAPQSCPTTLWDVFGKQGHPVRATVSDMGPLLLGRMLNLNDTQAGVLNLVFKIADDQGLLLLDLKDLRAMVQHVGENAKDFTTEYGNVSAASIGAIQRGLLTLDEQGGDFFEVGAQAASGGQPLEGGQAATVRDVVVRAQVQAGHLLPELLERIGTRPHDEVRFVGGHFAYPDTDDLDKGSGFVANRDLELVVSGERETEGVETGSEVGTRRGNAHVHRTNRQRQ
jgi:DNA helicase HerA-like ATPase